MQRCAAARALAAALLLGLAASPGHAAAPPPALVAVLVDSSGSVGPRELDRARQLATDVLRGLPPGSEVAVFTFDDQSRLVLPRTSKAGEVERALAGVRISGRHTALYDGLYDASRYLSEADVARRAILLITDGKDEQSALNLDDGLRLAEDGRIPVFAVGVGQVEERVLRRIAKLTGGQYHGAREAVGAALASAILAAPAGEARAAVSAAAAPAAPARLEREAAVAEMSPTVVSRMGSTEEYLEKTVVLRERPVLAVTRGPLAGQVFELSGTSATSLGRAKANDIVLDDVSISSQHCRIRPEEDGFTLLDLKSTNGTFVNERRVAAHKLAEGDVIKLGEMRLQFRMDQRQG